MSANEVSSRSYTHLKNYYLKRILRSRKKRFRELESDLELLISRFFLNIPTSNLANTVQNFYFEIGRRNRYVEDEMSRKFTVHDRVVYYTIYGCLPLVTFVRKHFDPLEKNNLRDNLTIYMLVRLIERCILLFHYSKESTAIDFIKNNKLPHPFSNKKDYILTIQERTGLKLSKIFRKYRGNRNEFLIHIIFLTALSAFEKTFSEDYEEHAWKKRMGIERYDTNFVPYYRPLRLDRYPNHFNYCVTLRDLRLLESKDALFSTERNIPILSNRDFSQSFFDGVMGVFSCTFWVWTGLILEKLKTLERTYISFCKFLMEIDRVDMRLKFTCDPSEMELPPKLFASTLAKFYYDDEEMYVSCTNKMVVNHIILERFVYNFIVSILPLDERKYLRNPSNVIKVVHDKDGEFWIQIKRGGKYNIHGEKIVIRDRNSRKSFCLSYIICLVFNLKLTERYEHLGLIDYCLVDDDFLAYVPDVLKPRINFKRDFRNGHKNEINYLGMLLGNSSARISYIQRHDDDEDPGYGSDDACVHYDDENLGPIKTVMGRPYRNFSYPHEFVHKILELIVANRDLLYDRAAVFGPEKEEKGVFLTRLEGLYSASDELHRVLCMVEDNNHIESEPDYFDVNGQDYFDV